MDREHRIEQVGEPDPVGLGNEPEKGAVALKSPDAAGVNGFKRGFAVAVKQFATKAAGGVLVGQLNDIGAMPANINDCYSVMG
jgi:hypothetical protein